MATAQTKKIFSRALVARALWIACLSILLVTISGCQLRLIEPTIPNTAGYLVSGLIESGNFANNGVTILNTLDFSEIKKISLPRSRIEVAEISQDGNLWLGLSGGIDWDDDRVIVLDAAGNQLAEINTCLYPTTGIWFYKDKAYIVCRDNGFIATVAQINTSTFQVDKKLEINLGSEMPFTATGSRLSGQYLAVTGLATSPSETLSYSVVVIIDLETNAISKEIQLGVGTDVWSILPYKENLYLLNIQGSQNEEKRDIFVVSPQQNQIVDSISLQTHSPLWGIISNDTLYSYHNSGWNSIFTSPERFVCETSLNDYSQHCTLLPESFDATDIDVINNQPCITHWGWDTLPGGLYCLQNGSLELMIESEDATLIVLRQ
jgi:hypothetical protein